MTDKQIDQLRRSLIMATWVDMNLSGQVELPTLKLAKKIKTFVKKKRKVENV